jgi:predicted DNA-binding transcriptional regulator AlpA
MGEHSYVDETATASQSGRKSESRLLRMADLKARGIVANWTTLLRWIAAGNFPPGIKLGPNTRAWPEADIEAWLESKRSASNGGA